MKSQNKNTEKLTTNCPKCDNDNAYHNGISYECPDCGYSWR